jgi:hypothetical protein
VVLDNEFYFIAAIAPLHHARECALFDSSNCITNNTENFGQLFNQNTQDLQCLPLSTIIPKVFHSKNERIQHFFHSPKQTYSENLLNKHNSDNLTTSDNNQEISTSLNCNDNNLCFEIEDYVKRGKIFIQLRKFKLLDFTYNTLYATSSSVEKDNWIKEGVETTDFHQGLNNFQQRLSLCSGLGLRSILKKKKTSLFRRQIKISDKVEIIEIFDTDFNTGPLRAKVYKDIPDRNKEMSIIIAKSFKDKVAQSVYSSFAHTSNSKNTHAFQVVVARKIEKTVNVMKNGIDFIVRNI